MVATRRRTTRGKVEKYEIGDKVEVSCVREWREKADSVIDRQSVHITVVQ